MAAQLGFGTSGIMGAALTPSGRLRLLETAWDQGIRHFDTAPLYGQGEAEVLLGRFARTKRETLTITTKFGLLPRSLPSAARPLIPLARVMNRRMLLPLRQAGSTLGRHAVKLRRRLPEEVIVSNDAELNAVKPDLFEFAKMSSTECRDTPPPVPYTPSKLRKEVENSLRKLNTDYIDYYLMHECRISYLNPGFIDCLDRLVNEGKILHYGLGSERWQTRCILERYSSKAWIIQIPDGFHHRDTSWYVNRCAAPLFTHSALRLSKEAGNGAERSLVKRWATLTDQHPDDPNLLGDLLLSLALVKNNTGCVVFSSRRPERIRANAALLRSTKIRSQPAWTWLTKIGRGEADAFYGE